MGFYELGNGCDSCDTVSSVLPNNMQMDGNSMSGMMSPYGAQANTVKQYTNTVSSGYAHGGNMAMMGNGSNGSTMGATTMTTTVPTTIVQTIPTVIQQQKQMKQVSVPGSSMVMVPAPTARIEGFSDGTSTNIGSLGGMHFDKAWIILGLVLFSALASNECCKYFLNKSLQLNDGSPMYYFAYAGVAILLTFTAYTYAIKN